jgi:competence protein ComEC
MISGAGLLAVLGFLVLARPDPSVLRATVCGVVAIVALSRGGRAAGVPALCAAIVVLLLFDPGLGRSYGFALSVLATAGLLVVAPGWRHRLARWMPRPLADALAVPAAAQLVCAPVIVMLSGTVSVVAIPANLLVAPAVAPATVLGVLMALIAPLSVGLAQLLAYLAWIPVAWIVAVARISAQLPGATVGWPQGTPGALLFVALVVVGWLAGPSLVRRRGLAAGLLALLLLGISPLGPRTPWPPVGTRAVFCDVGQGDGIVLPTNPGHAVLVDAGPDPDAIDRCLSDLGIRALDAVVLSHLHADHVEGLPGAFRGRTVGEVVVGPLDEPPEQAEEVRGWVAAAGVLWRRAAVGEERQVGDVRWQVVWPVRVIRGEGSDPNNASIVLVVDTGGVRLLLTGDVEAAAQAALVPLIAGLDPPVDVLKVPHHGSRSQDPELVATVHPRLAVVSVGAGNTYGHPAPETLAAYSDEGVPVLRTDLSGDIAVVGSGADLRLVPRG